MMKNKDEIEFVIEENAMAKGQEADVKNIFPKKLLKLKTINLKIILTVFLAVILMISSALIISQQISIDALKSEIEILSADKEALMEAHKYLLNRIDNQSEDLDYIESKLKTLLGDFVVMSASNQELSAEITNLNDKNKALSEENELIKKVLISEVIEYTKKGLKPGMSKKDVTDLMGGNFKEVENMTAGTSYRYDLICAKDYKFDATTDEVDLRGLQKGIISTILFVQFDKNDVATCITLYYAEKDGFVEYRVLQDGTVKMGKFSF